MTDDQRQWAIGRIRAKQVLWVHVAVYFLVNAFLVFLWAINNTDYFWPMWPMLGWGIGIVAHAVTIYFGMARISEEQIARELEGRVGVGR